MIRGRPTPTQARWAIGITVGVILALIVVALLGVVLWVVLDIYIKPRTATERKDLVQSFAIVVAGAVGSLSALAAVGNLYISRRNLQQQRELELERAERERELENQRAQEDALPAYLDQMVQLLNDEHRPLRQAKGGDEVSILARVRTLTVLPRLDGYRKASLMQFLYEVDLIKGESPVIDLSRADLSHADLSATMQFVAKSDDQSGGDDSTEGRFILREANLRETNLIGADLSSADLTNADLSGASLVTTDLRYANLSHARLSGATMANTLVRKANLSSADLTGAKLVNTDDLERTALSLDGATMPNGKKYEEWLKDREGRKEDAENE